MGKSVDTLQAASEFVAYLEKYKEDVAKRTSPIEGDDAFSRELGEAQLRRCFFELADAFGDAARYVRHVEIGNDDDINRYSEIMTACWDIGMYAMALYCEATKRQAALDDSEV